MIDRVRVRLLERIRARILAANVEFDQVDTDDEIGMLDCQERTDAIMAALFKR